ERRACDEQGGSRWRRARALDRSAGAHATSADRLRAHQLGTHPDEPGVNVVAKYPSRLDAVVNLAKRRGFVLPSGKISAGHHPALDYGTLGVELKEIVKRQWWQRMVRGRDDVVGIDSMVILPKQVWVASGHVGVFNDPLTECTSCHKRFRA